MQTTDLRPGLRVHTLTGPCVIASVRPLYGYGDGTELEYMVRFISGATEYVYASHNWVLTEARAAARLAKGRTGV